MKVCSKRFPSIIYEVDTTNEGVVTVDGLVDLKPVQLIEGYHKEGVTIEDFATKRIKLSTFKRGYRPLDEDNASSMRFNRAKKDNKPKPFVPNPFFLRQSMISSYLQCPDKFYDTQENGYIEDTIFTKIGTAIHGVMEDYFDPTNTKPVEELFHDWWLKYGPSAPELYEEWKSLVASYIENLKNFPKPNIIARELEFKTVIEGIPVSGTIDRIDRLDEHTLLIIDYKSNQMPYTPAELRNSVQFKLYTLALMTPALHDILGEYDKIVCAYDMLRTGKRQFVKYTKEELDTFKEWLVIIWAKILSGKDRNPQLNQYCSSCQKRHRCSEYLEMLESPASIVATEDIDMNKLAEEMDRLKQSKKMIDNRIGEIEAIIKNEIVHNGGPITIGGAIWSMKSQKTNSYPILKVLDLVKDDPVATQDIMNSLGPLSMSAIKRIKSLKQYEEQLKGIVEERYKNPSLIKQEIKEEE
jgi:CRISPR/Cas system-associated exonuclease Cas4 (RecB family)